MLRGTRPQGNVDEELSRDSDLGHLEMECRPWLVTLVLVLIYRICLFLARSRPHGRFAICPLSPPDQKLRLRCRIFQGISLLAKAEPTWICSSSWSAYDPYRKWQLQA
jgi:hypothetical protein